jgi:hypothetical protein
VAKLASAQFTTGSLVFFSSARQRTLMKPKHMTCLSNATNSTAVMPPFRAMLMVTAAMLERVLIDGQPLSLVPDPQEHLPPHFGRQLFQLTDLPFALCRLAQSKAVLPRAATVVKPITSTAEQWYRVPAEDGRSILEMTGHGTSVTSPAATLMQG